MQHLQPNTLLQGGRYRIIKTLGQGGFGITYLAEHLVLQRKVAIKEFFMKEHCNRNEGTSMVSVGSIGSVDLVERFKHKFLKEARLIADMDNQHIVRVFDAFEENGTVYYVMEYIANGCLNDMLKHVAFSEDTTLKFTMQIADALKYIHEMNVLHLDVKPANVLLRKNGDAVLIDFGISKRYDDAGGQTSTTPTGISKGYAPLEQYNQGMQNFSPCTDIYSLGATMYKMLTGNTPPEASVVNEDGLPDKPASITERTWSAVVKAMCPTRKGRPQNIDEFLEMINGVDMVIDVPCSINEETVVKEDDIHGINEENQDDIPTSLEEIAFCDKYGLNQSEKSFVDLGLSVLWANHNIGAKNPASEGIPSSWSNNFHSVENVKLRLPSTEELKELKENCSWKWIDEGEICGYLVKSLSTNNKIFLRASGKVDKDEVQDKSIGFYWSSSNSASDDEAYSMVFMSGTTLCYIKNPRRIKMSIRQVCSKN